MLRARRGGHYFGVRVRRIPTFSALGKGGFVALESRGADGEGDDGFGGGGFVAGRDQKCFRSLCSLLAVREGGGLLFDIGIGISEVEKYQCCF